MLPPTMFFQMCWSEKSKVHETGHPALSPTQQFSTTALKDSQIGFVFKISNDGLLGGAVVRNLPANVGDTG